MIMLLLVSQLILLWLWGLVLALVCGPWRRDACLSDGIGIESGEWEYVRMKQQVVEGVTRREID